MKISNYPNIGETVYTSELPNGLRLCVIPKPGFTTRYAAFATDYGGAHRRFEIDGRLCDTPAGVAHYLEHKMFDLPDGDNALNILSANGADPNAFTASDMTCYYFRCTEGFEENLRMLLHFVSTPYFTPETVEKERGIISQEIRMGEDSPGSAIYYMLLRLLYDHHPIRDRIAGTVESIADITAETLYDCHKVFYAPSNMVLCVEGDVVPEDIERIALELLPQEKAGVPHADFGAEESLLPAEKFISEEMEVSAPQFLIGAKLAYEHEGSAAQRQRLVSRVALRSFVGVSSPFYNRLYADGLLNSDFDFEVDYAAGTATVMIGGESEYPEKVFELLQAELETVRRDGLNAQLFERTKRAGIGSRLRGLEDFETTCLNAVEGIFNGFCAFDALSVLATITKEECEAFLLENLAPERLAMALVLPKR